MTERTLVLQVAALNHCPDVRDIDELCSGNGCEGVHPVSGSIKGIAAMLTSRLRSCLDIDIFGNCLRPCMSWVVIALGLTISVTQAGAEYRVNVGDVLEVAVAGVPELRQRAPVQMDG